MAESSPASRVGSELSEKSPNLTEVGVVRRRIRHNTYLYRNPPRSLI